MTMRVLMLSKALVVGAYQTKLEEMARQPGLALTVAVPPYWREGAHRLTLQRAHTAGYDLRVLEMALNGHYHMHFYPRLARLIGETRPHLLHIDEEPYNLATLQALVLGRRAGASCLFFTWQNIYRAQRWHLLERYVLGHAHAAIAGNGDALAILRRKGFRRPGVVIPQFGVDPTIYRPLPEARALWRQKLAHLAPAHAFVIGYAGRLVEQKGLRVLLQAVSGLPGEWRLLLLGDGPLRPEIEQTAAALGIAERVTLLPAMPSTDVPAWLNVLDCLVLPSLTRPSWQEQFGRILIEAMACEVAVVGSDSGEIPNVIADAGLTAREGDAAALRAQLARLADPAERRRLGRLGRDRVLRHYTQSSVAMDTCRFYARVADDRAAQSAVND